MYTKIPWALMVGLVVGFLLALMTVEVYSRQESKKRKPPPDAVADAQTPREVPADRPEQKKNDHDNSDVFAATNASPSSTAFDSQPDKGKFLGFDFRRDPLDSKKPMMTFAEIMREDVATKPKVMELQRKLLEGRYTLKPTYHLSAKMSRGKPIWVGPTARLGNGTTWEKLAGMSPED